MQSGNPGVLVAGAAVPPGPAQLDPTQFEEIKGPAANDEFAVADDRTLGAVMAQLNRRLYRLATDQRTLQLKMTYQGINNAIDLSKDVLKKQLQAAEKEKHASMAMAAGEMAGGAMGLAGAGASGVGVAGSMKSGKKSNLQNDVINAKDAQILAKPQEHRQHVDGLRRRDEQLEARHNELSERQQARPAERAQLDQDLRRSETRARSAENERVGHEREAAAARDRGDLDAAEASERDMASATRRRDAARTDAELKRHEIDRHDTTALREDVELARIPARREAIRTEAQTRNEAHETEMETLKVERNRAERQMGVDRHAAEQDLTLVRATDGLTRALQSTATSAGKMDSAEKTAESQKDRAHGDFLNNQMQVQLTMAQQAQGFSDSNKGTQADLLAAQRSQEDDRRNTVRSISQNMA